MRGLDELLVGPSLVVISLRVHGGVSGHVDGVLTFDGLGHEVINGDGASSVRIECELYIVPGRKRSAVNNHNNIDLLQQH